MKRIYLLMVLFIAAMGNSYAQRSIDLAIQHYIGKGTPVPVVTNSTKILINGLESYNVRWRIINYGPDSTNFGDTLRIYSPWGNVYVARFAMTGGISNLTANDTVTIFPVNAQGQEITVTLTPGQNITQSGKQNVNWCDSVALRKGSSNTAVTDPDMTNNKICHTIEADFWLTGINGEIYDNTQAMLVYPNPASVNKLFIKYNFGTDNAASVKVIDVTGRVVYTQDLGNNLNGTKDIEINLPQLSHGMYVLKMDTKTHSMTQTINILQ